MIRIQQLSAQLECPGARHSRTIIALFYSSLWWQGKWKTNFSSRASIKILYHKHYQLRKVVVIMFPNIYSAETNKPPLHPSSKHNLTFTSPYPDPCMILNTIFISL